MGEYHAPQWIDFEQAYSPQLPMQDYFEKEHTIHGRNVGLCDSTTENVQPNFIPENHLCINPEAQHDLNVIKNTPVKVISPKHPNKKIVALSTYDEVLGDAMRKLELCQKSVTRDTQKLAQGLRTNAFKTPNVPIVKSSKSVGFRSLPNKLVQFNGMPSTLVEVNKNDIHTPQEENNTSVSIKKTSVNCSLFKEDKNPVCDAIIKESHDDDSVDVLPNDEKDQQEVQYNKVNGPSSDNDKNSKEVNQDVLDTTTEKHNKTLCKRANGLTVLPWHSNRRRSFNKCKTSGNYVGLAEAALRFQNETPKRFRTRSTKNTTLTNFSKLNRLKPTIPISPALISKNRTRAVTVLSQEEREKQVMEEMKKHPIKANPIPRNILRGPRTTITKKATAVTARAPSAVTSALSKNSAPYDKASTSKKTVTKVVVTSPGILVEREQASFFGIRKDIATKTATRVVPFSFEARNKDFQIKKEQRLKNLQEANKIKPEFHATPVPSFLKQNTTSIKKQNEKKKINSCPFSFEERNKNLLKKKGELVKHALEDEKKLRVFRANPVPVFKPVIVRGTSKEYLLSKDKTTKIEDENVDKCDNQENKEPNTIAFKPKMDSKHAQKSIIDRRSAPLKVKQDRNTNFKNISFKLNTDKRAKERREFDEKIKCKELEDEIKRREENKERLEHEKSVKAEIRKLAEVKARPMPIYKPLCIIKTTKPLTNPQSPAFASKLKLKQT